MEARSGSTQTAAGDVAIGDLLNAQGDGFQAHLDPRVGVMEERAVA